MDSNSATVKRRVSNTRCGETAELKRVTGSVADPTCGGSSISLASAAAAGASLVTNRLIGPARRIGAPAVCARPRPISVSRPGAESANQGAGGASAGGLALVSNSSALICASCCRPTAARWVLSSSAKLPTGRSRKLSRPSMT